VEVERLCQDEILNLLLIIRRIVPRSLKRPVKAFRTIVAIGDHAVLVREVALSVVEGGDSPEGGVLTYLPGAEDLAVVAEGRVHCGTPHNLYPSALFTGYDLLWSGLVRLSVQ
jgi:hypothetical protein